jgi:glycosyltransferase involved in cell wall biosynthesis
MKPHLYALLPRPAHASRDGGSIRMHHLLAAVAPVFRVRAFVLASLGAARGEFPASVEVVEIPHRAGRWRRAAAAGAGLFSGAYSERLYRSRALDRALAHAVTAERPAWVVAFSYHLGPAALRSGAPAWIDFQNLDSEIWSRLGKTASRSAVRAFARNQAPRVAALERRLVAAVDGISCVSARDARAIEALSPRAAPLTVPNGVDLLRFAFRAEPASEELLFFAGDLSWPPNAEGIRWFRERVWPLVRRQRPQARVEVLGRGAPRDLVARRDEGFRLLGEGEDARAHWREAAVGIVPLLAGGGTRLKILEAAACGVPVVSTAVGAEGLDMVPGSEIALAETPEAFADAIATLLSQPDARRRQAAAARRRVESRYDWAPIGDAFARELLRRSAR